MRKTENITGKNRLIKLLVYMTWAKVRTKKAKKGTTTEPWWEKRAESEIRELRIDTNVLDREKMVQ